MRWGLLASGGPHLLPSWSQYSWSATSHSNSYIHTWDSNLPGQWPPPWSPGLPCLSQTRPLPPHSVQLDSLQPWWDNTKAAMSVKCFTPRFWIWSSKVIQTGSGVCDWFSPWWVILSRKTFNWTFKHLGQKHLLIHLNIRIVNKPLRLIYQT